MTPSEISLICVDSCKKYYEFLDRNSKGVDEIQITQKEKLKESDNLWLLRLGSRIYNYDLIKIKNLHYQTFYDENHYDVESYDPDTNRIIIRFKQPVSDFDKTPTDELLIVSDLKFLIENVRKWFLQNGQQLGLPMVSPGSIFDENLVTKESANADQLKAIKNCLKTSFYYIWGPPGTGKTRFVLTHSILNYYYKQESCRIGVFAPTNNSLEQMMVAILAKADEFGIPRNKFFRMGTPSHQFATVYPEVCEVTGIEKNRKEINNQLQILNGVLTYRLAQNAINSADSLIPNLTEIQDFLLKRDDLLLLSSKIETEITSLKKEASSLIVTFKKMISPKVPKVEILIMEKTKQLADLKLDITKNEDLIEIRLARIKRIKTGSDKIDNSLNSLSFQNIDQVKSNIIGIRNNTQNFILLLNAHVEEYQSLTLEELQLQKENLTTELHSLESMGMEERVKGCFVFGSTFDSYIGRFQNERLSFTHVFIDEAGYVPLIKALVLCANNVPITFLGDHKQLPPVCEMNDNELANPMNKSVILWSTPALYCGSAFKLNRTDFLQELHSNDPQMHELKKTNLRATHRFGPNLTEILNRLFYQFDFRSSNVQQNNYVNFFVVDAPFSKKIDKKGNVAECFAIQKLLKNIATKDYIVLTPYKRQVALLRDKVPLLRNESKVITVHKSQGREWDTVIISIVDCQHITPWFTDTLNVISKGAQVMNTAISRVKYNLYVVCDRAYWLSRSDHQHQLVSNLVANAKTLNLSENI